MAHSRIDALKTKAKLLQKAKRKAGKPIQLKEALQKVASAAGFSSWRELRESFSESDILCPSGSSAFWKTWYNSYEEARLHLTAKDDIYLLPYGKQFFICDHHWIDHLGLSQGDPDLLKVGRNWAEPKDMEAWSRVLKRIKLRT